MSVSALWLPLLLAQSGTGLPIGVGAMREGSVPRHSGSYVPQMVEAPPSRLQLCLNAATQDPGGALDAANAWLREAKGSEQAQPRMCLGSAYSARQDWDAATQNFVAGRDIAAASDHLLRARLGAMAGNAALAAAAWGRALPLLDMAHADALAVDDPQLAADIAIDRARALVALNRDAEAATALAEARTGSPGNAAAWLLSATLSRRLKQWRQAQAQIETAAQLAPRDPEVGLEAGVIAMLSGTPAAAGRSWQSVIAAAPDSASADTARGYLAQLGSGPATDPPPRAEPGR